MPRTSRMTMSTAFLSDSRLPILRASAWARGFSTMTGAAAVSGAAFLRAAFLRAGSFLAVAFFAAVFLRAAGVFFALFFAAGFFLGVFLSAIRVRRTLAPLPLSVDHVLLAGQFLESHGAKSVQSAGGNADLRAQAQFAPVVETGGGVPRHAAPLDFPGEAPRP